jgi:hypothetical protein
MVKAPFLHKQVQVFQTFWRKILTFFQEIVGTRYERDNVRVANINDAVSLPPPIDLFSKP